VALKKAVWFKWAARIWGLGKLTTSIVQSGLFCIFIYSTLKILIVALIYCRISAAALYNLACSVILSFKFNILFRSAYIYFTALTIILIENYTNIHYLSIAFKKMASEALPTKKGRGAMDREIYTLVTKFSD
jgi:hypothetical protein